MIIQPWLAPASCTSHCSEGHITSKNLSDVTAQCPAHPSTPHMLLIFSHPFPACFFLLKNIDCKTRSRFPLAMWVSRNTEEIHSYFTFYLPLLSTYYLPGCANLEGSVVDILSFFFWPTLSDSPSLFEKFLHLL